MYLKLFAFVLFLAWILYWQIEQYKTYKAKPLSTEKSKLFNVVSRIGIRILFVVVVTQLLGLKILPMQQYITTFQYAGLILVFLGIIITISARVTLATNWSNAYEYQIKKGQELVTGGIYHLLRHPIYSGMVFMFIGAEMIAGSWLWISFFGLFVGAYVQGKREEKILLAHFGEKYRKYMRHTKMLIPFVL